MRLTSSLNLSLLLLTGGGWREQSIIRISIIIIVVIVLDVIVVSVIVVIVIILKVTNQRLTFRFRNFSVSKLLGFETFAKSLRVSVSVSENLVSEKKSRFRFRNNLVSEKVSVSVSENLVSENKKSKQQEQRLK